MIDLGQRSGPYEIALPYGLSITMKPFTSAGMPVAQDAARRAVEAIEPHAREHTPRLAARFIQCDQVEPSRWAAERLFRKPGRNGTFQSRRNAKPGLWRWEHGTGLYRRHVFQL